MFVEIKIDHHAQYNLLPTTAAFEAMPAAMKPRTTSSQRKPMRPMIMTFVKDDDSSKFEVVVLT